MHSDATNITSPNYPLNYPEGIMCHWTIINKASIETVLDIRWLDIHQTLLCSGDFVSFSFDGNTRVCGYMKENILRTKASVIEITFKTDYTVQKSGFYIQIYSSSKCVYYIYLRM